MKGTHKVAIPLRRRPPGCSGCAQPGRPSSPPTSATARRRIAHRGSGAMAPENTLASVRLALKQGADYIENDIMRTSDGALVITHDLTLARTTNVEQVFPDRAPWNIADFTLAEIKQLDAGSWFSAAVRRPARPDAARVGRGRRLPRRHAPRGQGPVGLPGHRA